VTGAAAPIRVVLVDDEKDVLLLLEVQFRAMQGFEVVGTARDGAEALAVVEQTAPDAVVMDLLMPGMSGFEAIAHLLQDAPGAALIAHTGVAGEYVRNEMARLDVGLVLKSGDAGPLAEAVQAEVERKRNRG